MAKFPLRVNCGQVFMYKMDNIVEENFVNYHQSIYGYAFVDIKWHFVA